MGHGSFSRAGGLWSLLPLRTAAWEQFDAAYELVSWNSSASTLSLFDGDDISRDGLEGLLEAWTEAGAVGA